MGWPISKWGQLISQTVLVVGFNLDLCIIHKNYESNQFTVKLYCVKSEYDNVKKVIDRKIKFDKLMWLRLLLFLIML